MIKIKIDRPEAEPYRKHRWDAGWDLKSQNETFILKPGAKVKVSTGVSIEVPVRHMGLVVPRSGLGSKYKVGLANTVGVIDSEYRGEITVALVNDGNKPVTINKFDRFCQLIIVPVNTTNLRVVDNLSDTDRGIGGYGSTGISEVGTEAKDYEGLELEEILEWTEVQDD